jgi:2,4-dienoyl-CoA reductase-like NADH-dependent reductase (Old Yellow Enzyme family)/thioredoxin reductase
MDLIKPNRGRRQFLIAAGVTSTLGLGLKKLAGVYEPDNQTGLAMASEKSDTAGIKGALGNKYCHLLAPIKIGSVVLKNRMMQTPSFPRLLQGPEYFPTEQIIDHYASVAKNGCGLVCCFAGEPVSKRESGAGEGAHMAMWDLNDVTVQHYLAQMTDSIHFYGSKAIVAARRYFGESSNAGNVASIQAGPAPLESERNLPALPPEGGQIGGIGGGPVNDIPVETIQKWRNYAAPQALLYQSLGFDGIYLRIDMMGGFLSPKTNSRTDQYGGSVENRARAFLELFQNIKKACGQHFLIVGAISAESEDGGYNAKDVAQFAKVWEGALDILVLRGTGASASHPNGYNLKRGKHFTIADSQAIKESGTKMVIAVNGGYQDLDQNEEYIASGRTDMIAMARAWIADPEYGKKAYEGRGEDVTPCILCAECHSANAGPWMDYCSVNPKFGIAHKLDRMIDAPAVSRKVAVVGGGPAGMKAAITAAERGHKVTLYEKNDFLGGQLRHADFASFQWPIKDFKDYLIRQLKKAGVELYLSTKATPEMIRQKEYDAVILALGAEPIIPDIPGAKGRNVRPPIYIFGNENSLGKNVAVIGGDQIGTQTGMYLAEKGLNVTMLTTAKTLAPDISIYINQGVISAYQSLTTFKYITEATVTAISEGKVNYKDARGNEKSVQADSVVIYAGRKPRIEEAMKFAESGKRFFVVGDCSGHGDLLTHFQANVWTSVRSGFAAASEI